MRIFLPHVADDLGAFPLESDPLEQVFPDDMRVRQNVVDLVEPVRVDGAEVKFHVRVFRLQGGAEVFGVEERGALRRPRASGVRRVAVRLVLVHHAFDRDPAHAERLDVLAEIVRIRLQIARVHDEVVLAGDEVREPAGTGLDVRI